MRVEDSEHSKQCRPNQTFPSHCVVLKVILGLSLTAPCSQTYYNLRASPSNKLQTYLKEPLEDQQTILHFRRVGHLNLSCPWEKRSFCWLQHYCTNWTFGFTVDWNLWNAEIAPWLVSILSSLVLSGTGQYSRSRLASCTHAGSSPAERRCGRKAGVRTSWKQDHDWSGRRERWRGGGFLQGRSLGTRLVPGQYVAYNRGGKFSKMT